MYTSRVFNPVRLILYSIKLLLIFSAYAADIVSLYVFLGWEWIINSMDPPHLNRDCGCLLCGLQQQLRL